MTRYFVSPEGNGSMEIADGPFSTAAVPEGWQEVTVEEYRARQDAARQAVAEEAAAFIASDGDVPPTPNGTVPIDELPGSGNDSQPSDGK
ncbi:hypothetical protein [Streptomyces carpinensis]|uniref:Uncharacterized protein n=1 Tax=Streptomyces carpinensis TaxID=66369 RepID=A0ABV1VUU2_9ACTN|nr:hypothetical protein [Streptomyces carpinensis]